MMADSAKLRQAMASLGKIYGVKDRNTFMKMLLNEAAGSTTPPAAPSFLFSAEPSADPPLTTVDDIADVVLGLTGEGLYIDEMIAKFDAFTKGNAADPLAEKLLDIKKDPLPCFRIEGNTSFATRNGPRLAMCWAVSNISTGTCSSSSFSGGRSRPSR